MRRWCIAIASSVLATAGVARAAPPERVVIDYEVRYNGSTMATAQHVLEHDGKTYRLVETWEGSGLLSLLGEVRRTSEGRVTPEGLRPLVYEAVRVATPWERKLELLDQMSDVFDAAMVEDGIIAAHPKFAGSASSGYRLMEHAYAELIQKLPAEIKTVVPVWDQVHWERFHSGYVATLDMETWDRLSNLTPLGSQESGVRSQ